MELFFLLLLIALMAGALGSGYPVAFALPGTRTPICRWPDHHPSAAVFRRCEPGGDIARGHLQH
mgnify:CR=1 FL=1